MYAILILFTEPERGKSALCEIRNASGHDIKTYSANPQEDEILLLRGTKLKVHEVLDPDVDQLKYVVTFVEDENLYPTETTETTPEETPSPTPKETFEHPSNTTVGYIKRVGIISSISLQHTRVFNRDKTRNNNNNTVPSNLKDATTNDNAFNRDNWCNNNIFTRNHINDIFYNYNHMFSSNDNKLTTINDNVLNKDNNRYNNIVTCSHIDDIFFKYNHISSSNDNQHTTTIVNVLNMDYNTRIATTT
ncbi:probable cyclin-dependent serine/threonine-protein kinase DDB_G0292550 [Liolophura sinensis]|uniref:probable cyclin-dependent serine/threonine-protein kinase DDB_G0292550 n=1 Tax=Liolophura sinensis TaxID=3198878 RepID=UPI0031588A86